jgi:hypothetical protein
MAPHHNRRDDPYSTHHTRYGTPPWCDTQVVTEVRRNFQSTNCRTLRAQSVTLHPIDCAEAHARATSLPQQCATNTCRREQLLLTSTQNHRPTRPMNATLHADREPNAKSRSGGALQAFDLQHVYVLCSASCVLPCPAVRLAPSQPLQCMEYETWTRPGRQCVLLQARIWPSKAGENTPCCWQSPREPPLALLRKQCCH